MEKETSNITNNDNWQVINSYFQDKHLHQLVKHQIESYNDFIQNQMKKKETLISNIL